jgi:hypothetical protein
LKTKALITIPFLLVILAVALLVQASPTTLIVHASGTADEYGNYIQTVVIQQLIDEEVETIETITFADYEASMEVQLTESVPTYVLIYVQLNDTLAGSTAEAVTNTNVTLSVSGATIYAGTPQGTGPDGGFYTVSRLYTWNDGPEEGITYTCILSYKVKIVE